MIMKADGSAYIVPASVYDEQPISRTYQYRKVRELHNYAYVISLYNTWASIATVMDNVQGDSFTPPWDLHA